MEEIINTKELLRIFGNDKQKNSTLNSGIIQKKTRDSLVNKAKIFCDIETLGYGKFKIKEWYTKELPNMNEFKYTDYKRIERTLYDCKYDNLYGVYSIVLGNKIYIGSTIAGFRNRHMRYRYKNTTGNDCLGYYLYTEGGEIDILWSTDIKDTEMIRNKEVEFIRKYSEDDEWEVINSEIYVQGCSNRELMTKIEKSIITIRQSDYEKVVELLNKNNINILKLNHQNN